VPFGEYVPFTQTIPWLKALGSVTRDQYQPGEWPSPVFDVGGYRLALNLCVEDIHPDIAREAVLAGADTLVNLTNDGWFYGTFGPGAHLRAAAWRAIEMRRPLLRVTNTGYTVAVDPLGNVEILIPPETEGVAVARLQRIGGEPPRTWSMLLGEWGCAAAMASILAGCLWLGRRARAFLH
jgi:apolipoprotein N-acyltransferase